MNYPIPVHAELKTPKGKLSPWQEKEKKRVERSGSIFLVVRSPEDLHNFFVEHGLKRMITPAQGVVKDFKEKHLNTFVRDYLVMAEHIYGVYWIRNQQGLGNKKGRSDYYFEIPNIPGG